ncbi:hypothetical protein NS365_18360 [Aureimonas ureilytica]|uniref:HTH araC/xylS-type domain-containing protein n=2 Tax=Aureimonas ureilytica TaxID=401562 RepID=A0A175RL75_9HYPH|nr:hypothetical protein NS365_18360 [Aureimonas ureilytica]
MRPNWLFATDPAKLDPAFPVRGERASDDLGIYVMDVFLDHAMRFRTEGPAAFSVSIFLSGNGMLMLDGGQPLRVRAGSAVLFASRGHASGENAFSAGQNLLCVDFRYAADFLDRLGESPFASARRRSAEASVPSDAILLGFRASPNLLRIAADVVRCPLSPGLARRLAMLARGIDVLSELTLLVEAPTATRLALPAPSDRRRIGEARTILDEDYAGVWTISRLSQAVGLNQRKLKRGFHDLVGMPPHAYLKEQRLQAAYRMLETGWSVTETASRTGFSNLSHFAKAFRHRFGTVPSTVRAGSTSAS